jgi:hypothetical protein
MTRLMMVAKAGLMLSVPNADLTDHAKHKLTRPSESQPDHSNRKSTSPTIPIRSKPDHARASATT